MPPVVDLSTHAIFCDFDGTLVDIAATPDAILPPETLFSILDKLTRYTHQAFAIVTGRQVVNLAKHIDISRLCVSGCHGTELHIPSKHAKTLKTATIPLPVELLQKALSFAAEHGLLVEDKKHTLALHYRDQPSAEQLLDHFLQEAVSPYPQLVVMKGKCIREIKPASYNKGSALEKLMADAPFKSRTPLFIGDDVTDEHAFEYVNQVGGVSIKVGKGETVAQFRLASPDEVLNYLERLIQEYKQHDIA